MEHIESAWWGSAVIYQVYPRSFADSNGDGIGDLAGVRARLPYLRDLGVDAVWLSPFYPSPMIDGGYDVSDYRGVDPMFGTLADFDAMLDSAHRNEIRIIVDIVPNHSSAAHPWFIEALAAPPGSPARDRFIFRDSGDQPPNNWVSIFGGPAWTRVHDGQWYVHLFDPAQPDLNWANREVRDEFSAILRFWLDRGVDGFRIDVAHGLVKQDGLPDLAAHRTGLLDTRSTPYFDQEEVHDIYREWRKILDSYPGERFAVAEAWVPSPERLARYVRPDELHQAFNFDLLTAPWRADALRTAIDDSLSSLSAVGAPATWVIGNHDTIRPATRYGNLDRARAAALMLLALPGSAYIHQGEELGLPEVTDLPDTALRDPIWERSGHTLRGRDGCRVPLPWSADSPHFGFSTAEPWLPQPESWAGFAASTQDGAKGSTLELYRAAIGIRRSRPALTAGGLRWVPSPPDTLLFVRSDPTPSGIPIACAVNVGSIAVELPIVGELLLSSGPMSGGSMSGGSMSGAVLPPDTAAWLALPAAPPSSI